MCSKSRWKVIRIRGNKAEQVCVVAAANEQAAIRCAIITSPEQGASANI